MDDTYLGNDHDSGLGVIHPDDDGVEADVERELTTGEALNTWNLFQDPFLYTRLVNVSNISKDGMVSLEVEETGPSQMMFVAELDEVPRGYDIYELRNEIEKAALPDGRLIAQFVPYSNGNRTTYSVVLMSVVDWAIKSSINERLAANTKGKEDA